MSHDKYNTYIDFLCSSVWGGGSKILKTIEEDASKQGKWYLHLYSVASAVGFYKKKGFIKRMRSNDMFKIISKTKYTFLKKLLKLYLKLPNFKLPR